MENGISVQYIENAIQELNNYFGVKEPILGENIFLLIRNGKVKDAVKLIARQLGLPIDISIIYVPTDYKAQNSDNQFKSKYLAKINKKGTGSEGITAQVTIPSNLPSYFSSNLDGFLINVKISENCAQNPISFTLVMAHELSHILLHSLFHLQKDNEFYTDLTAIMQGFQIIFKKGRRKTVSKITTNQNGSLVTTTNTTTFGYLSDEQFSYAYNKINRILGENRNTKLLLSKEAKHFNILLSNYEITLLNFKLFLDYFSKNTNKKMYGEAGRKMIIFFQPGYLDEYNLLLKDYKRKLEIIILFVNELSQYTTKNLNHLSIHSVELKKYSVNLIDKVESLRKDIKVINKYVSYSLRIKVFFIHLIKRIRNL
jgi:hypothetical protein